MNTTSRLIHVVAPLASAHQAVDLALNTAIQVTLVALTRDANAAASFAVPAHLPYLASIDVVAVDQCAIALRAVDTQIANEA